MSRVQYKDRNKKEIGRELEVKPTKKTPWLLRNYRLQICVGVLVILIIFSFVIYGKLPLHLSDIEIGEVDWTKSIYYGAGSEIEGIILPIFLHEEAKVGIFDKADNEVKFPSSYPRGENKIEFNLQPQPLGVEEIYLKICIARHYFSEPYESGVICIPKVIPTPKVDVEVQPVIIEVKRPSEIVFIKREIVIKNVGEIGFSFRFRIDRSHIPSLGGGIEIVGCGEHRTGGFISTLGTEGFVGRGMSTICEVEIGVPGMAEKGEHFAVGIIDLPFTTKSKAFPITIVVS